MHHTHTEVPPPPAGMKAHSPALQTAQPHSLRDGSDALQAVNSLRSSACMQVNQCYMQCALGANWQLWDACCIPGSPSRMGLFLVRLPRIWITRATSRSRPMTCKIAATRQLQLQLQLNGKCRRRGNARQAQWQQQQTQEAASAVLATRVSRICCS